MYGPFQGVNVPSFLWGLIVGANDCKIKKRGYWKQMWILCLPPHYDYECHCADVNPEQTMPFSDQWALSSEVRQKRAAGEGQAGEWEGKACWDHNPFTHVKTDLSYCSACGTSITFRSHSFWKHSEAYGWETWNEHSLKEFTSVTSRREQSVPYCYEHKTKVQ